MTKKRAPVLPEMVNVGDKAVTHRIARAQACVSLPKEIAVHIRAGDIVTRKGPVFPVAVVAGTMAAKRTSEWIPFCHPLRVEQVHLGIRFSGKHRVVIECRVETHDKTGVEMEALIGATCAALTVYDMCKGYSHNIRITDVRLLEKRGGKSDYRR